MSTKVESDLHAFNLTVDKFAARWNQLKPKEDMIMAAGSDSAKQVITSLQEQRKEFDELVSTSSRLTLV